MTILIDANIIESRKKALSIRLGLEHRVMVQLYGEEPDFLKAYHKAIDEYMIVNYTRKTPDYIVKWITKYIRENYKFR